MAVAVASTLSGFPAGLGSQLSLYPGDSRRSSESVEDSRGDERQRLPGQGGHWEM